MTTLASGIDHQLDALYGEWEDTFGFGPCGAYAAMRREDGWGDVAVCQASTSATGAPFTHYIIVQDGDIIDLANPLGEELTYTDIDILKRNEMPELIDACHVQWLRDRMTA